MAAENEPSSSAARCVSAIPMFLSYIILGLTWLAFVPVITIHTVLLKRLEFAHFFFQFIIFNGLYLMTITSLFFASTRNPGQPNQALAPEHLPSSTSSGNAEKPPGRSNGHTERRQSRPPPIAPPPSGIDQDDIPLRYLRNKQWVTSRIGKDRPSPLPLGLGRKNSTAGPTTLNGGTSSSSSDGPAVSPFPMGVNPLMPNSAAEAGEDDDEIGPNHTEDAVEGGHDEEDGERDGAEDRLLPATPTRRSIMAKSNDGSPRWCRKCEAWKPDRTHHCRYCKRCTLKMDHHCAWLGTCVGFHNYKPFLLFITYGTLLAIYSMIEAGYESFRFFQDPDAFFSASLASHESGNGTTIATSDPGDDLDPSPLIFLGLALVGLVFALSVGSLAVYHWWLTLNNLTTLENLDHSGPSVLLERVQTPRAGQGGMINWKPDHLLSRDERNRLRREARAINVYDLGWRTNVKSVFGDRSTFLAFWPMFAAYRRDNLEAGHFFDVDDEKLERLTRLTRELRCGMAEVENGYKSESEDESSDDGTYVRDEADGDVPWTGTSGSRGDDELSDGDGEDGERDGTGMKKVAWFDADH